MAKHFILESWISFNIEGPISNPSSFCGFYVFFQVFSFEILYVISETCDLRENNLTKINLSIMYELLSFAFLCVKASCFQIVRTIDVDMSNAQTMPKSFS